MNTQQSVCIIFGPTGSGKTDIVSELAERFDVSLVSADSVQVYRGLDIGSAKPSLKDRSKFPHYLIDIKDPSESFTVADFISCADYAIDEILAANRIPVVSGGTAYYIKHLIYGLSSAPQSDPVVRRQVDLEEEKYGLDLQRAYIQ